NNTISSCDTLGGEGRNLAHPPIEKRQDAYSTSKTVLPFTTSKPLQVDGYFQASAKVRPRLGFDVGDGGEVNASEGVERNHAAITHRKSVANEPTGGVLACHRTVVDLFQVAVPRPYLYDELLAPEV